MVVGGSKEALSETYTPRKEFKLVNTYRILSEESGEVDLRLKIILLVISILIPFGLVNTIALRNLYLQVAATAHNEQHLTMVGNGFFSMFIINIFMAIMVAAVAVGIIFWAVRPWEKQSHKIIKALGGNFPPPQGKDKVYYVRELLDKIDKE